MLIIEAADYNTTTNDIRAAYLALANVAIVRRDPEALIFDLSSVGVPNA
jgi:hypothetical protein